MLRATPPMQGLPMDEPRPPQVPKSKESLVKRHAYQPDRAPDF
jgi:hypothetical protein